MEDTREVGLPPAERPRRSSTRTILIVVAALIVLVFVVRPLVALAIVLWPVSETRAQRFEDMNNLRQIALCVIVGRGEVPLAPDGRIDIYRILREENVGPDKIVKLCHSSRAGKGPTWNEIEAGDYRNFAYQRYHGVLSRPSDVRVPILWDPRPSKTDHVGKGRLAAFTDGSARFEEEAVFRDFFRARPGQE